MSKIIILVGFAYFNPRFTIDVFCSTYYCVKYVVEESIDKTIKLYKNIK